MKTSLLSLPLLGLGLALSSVAAIAAEEVKLTPMADRVRIEIGGKLFSEFVFKGAPRPYFYPILMPDGTGLTRDWPQKDTTPGEEKDHPHHHSLWYGHGVINDGQDFWREIDGTGTIQIDGAPEVKSGSVGTIRFKDRWVDKAGKVNLTDEVNVRIQAVPGGRLFDMDITLHALPSEPLLLADTKEGFMGIRLAQWMTLLQTGKKDITPGAGHILLSTGQTDNAAWGKNAEWCDFYAPRNGKVYGVAIFDHPTNPRHPTPWMVRGYGMYNANPFLAHEINAKEIPAGKGDMKLAAGTSVTFRYRFYFHEGDPAASKVGEMYKNYAAGK